MSFPASGPTAVKHTYLQDRLRPNVFHYLPDEFLLARTDQVTYVPALAFQIGGTEQAPTVVLNSLLRPSTDSQRLVDALPALAARVPHRAGLDPTPVLQPLVANATVRLQLPGGARDLDEPVDLANGFWVTEELSLDDFQPFFGLLAAAPSSPTALRGTVTVHTGLSSDDIVQVQLNLRHMVGEIFSYAETWDEAAATMSVTITNATESSQRIQALPGWLRRGAVVVPVQLGGLDLSSPVEVAPEQSLTFSMTAAAPLPGEGSVDAIVDLGAVTSVIDPEVILGLALDETVLLDAVRPVKVFTTTAGLANAGQAAGPITQIGVEFRNGPSVMLDAEHLQVDIDVPVPLAAVLIHTDDESFEVRQTLFFESGTIRAERLAAAGRHTAADATAGALRPTMNLTGLPDWHAPLDVGGRTVYAAYERPGEFYAAPVRWEAAGDREDPPFLVETYQQDLGTAGLAEFGLLTLRFRASFDLGELADHGLSGLPEARFTALPIDEGLVQLTAPEEFGLPPELLNPYAVETAALVSPAVVARVDGPTADLVVGALRRGLATVGATAHIAASGIGCRYPGEITLDAARWTQAVSSLTPADGSMIIPVEVLRSLVSEDVAAVGVGTATWPDAADRTAFTDAVWDRLLGRLARLAGPPAGTQGVHIRLEPIAGELRFDLSEPVVAPRFWSLSADPLGPLRTLTIAELEAVVLRRHQIPSLSSGWHLLAFSPTLVTPTLGVASQFVEVEVPPAPPKRPQRLRRTVALTSGTAATTTVRLGPTEPLTFRWHLATLLESATVAKLVPGPEQTGDQSWTPVRPDETSLRYIGLEASPALLAEASVQVTVTATVDGDPWVVTGSLDSTRLSAVAVLPARAADPVINAVATAPDGRQAVIAPVAATRLRLDPFSFPGPGVRRLTVSIPPGSADTVVEIAGQDDLDQPERHGVLALTAGAPATTWSWYARSPFRLGACWRLRGALAWSDPTEGPITVSADLAD